MSARSNGLLTTLNLACIGTLISPKELLRQLTASEVTSIMEGELTVEDLRTIVQELVEDKENALIYRVPSKSSGPQEYPE